MYRIGWPLLVYNLNNNIYISVVDITEKFSDESIFLNETTSHMFLYNHDKIVYIELFPLTFPVLI